MEGQRGVEGERGKEGWGEGGREEVKVHLVHFSINSTQGTEQRCCSVIS